MSAASEADFQAALAETRQATQDLHEATQRLRRARSKTYRATRDFALPGSKVELRNGDEILFDGSEAEFRGVRFPVRLQGAIRVGWLVPVAPTK